VKHVKMYAVALLVAASGSVAVGCSDDDADSVQAEAEQQADEAQNELDDLQEEVEKELDDAAEEIDEGTASA
jgi:peptidoglycan hydrolase CwlO-like protein